MAQDRNRLPLPSAAEFSRRRFGRGTSTRTRSATITASEQAILPNDPDRIFWSIENVGVIDARLSRRNGITSSTGRLLAAAGGFLESTVEEDGEAVTQQVFAISTGNVDVEIEEIFADREPGEA